MTVNLKDRLKPDAVVKGLPSVVLSPEKRAQVFDTLITQPAGEKASLKEDLYGLTTKEEDKNYSYGTPPEFLPGGDSSQGKTNPYGTPLEFLPGGKSFIGNANTAD